METIVLQIFLQHIILNNIHVEQKCTVLLDGWIDLPDIQN